MSFDADWYDYETKYSSGLSSTQIPADLPEAISSRAQQLAIEAVQAVGASGLSRVDFFYEEASGSLLINEINTLPGFTSQSIGYMLWSVNPGKVLISLIQSCARSGSKKKSTLAIPSTPTALQACNACSRTRSVTSSGSGAGIRVLLVPALYFVL